MRENSRPSRLKEFFLELEKREKRLQVRESAGLAGATEDREEEGEVFFLSPLIFGLPSLYADDAAVVVVVVATSIPEMEQKRAETPYDGSEGVMVLKDTPLAPMLLASLW